jgi:hypothetical protein
MLAARGRNARFFRFLRDSAMKTFRDALLQISLVGSFLIGFLCVYLAWQIHLVSSHARPDAKILPLADLASKGIGDNLHVQLEGFVFGEPVIDKSNKIWNAVWLPLHTEGSDPSKSVPLAFLRTEAVNTRAELKDFVANTAVVRGLVGSALPVASRLRVKPSGALRKAYPDHDFSKAVLLGDAKLDVLGAFAIGEEHLFDASLARVGASVGAGALGVGFICLCVVLLAIKPRGERTDLCRSDLRVTPGMREKLARETPRASFVEDSWPRFTRSFSYVGQALLCWLLSAIVFAVMANYLAKNEVRFDAGTVLGGLFVAGLGVFFLGLGLHRFRDMLRMRNGVSEIGLCDSGLRWIRHGKAQQALWNEIAHVFRYTHSHAYRGGGVVKDHDEVTIQLHSGDSLYFNMHSLADYESFADALLEELKRRDEQASFPTGLNLDVLRALDLDAR